MNLLYVQVDVAGGMAGREGEVLGEDAHDGCDNNCAIRLLEWRLLQSKKSSSRFS